MPTRLASGISRLKDNWAYILQVSLAAGIAYWVGVAVGHPQPFFAPMSVVIVLSTTGGERFRKAIELVVGVSLGVGLGDLIVSAIGTGAWQIAAAVMVAITIGMLLGRSVLVANQAAFASILVATILPPSSSGGFVRMTDALIGGAVGLVVLGLFPLSPLKSGRREVSKMLGITSTILGEVAEELPRSDAAEIAATLRAARGTQGGINKMIAAAQESKEAVQVSPFMWRNREQINEMLQVLIPVDNAIRNTRVLARQALVVAENRDRVSDTQVEVIRELSDVAGDLSDVLLREHDSACAFAPLIHRLTTLAGRVGPEIAEGRPLAAQGILMQSRSIIIDLLEICGVSRARAVTSLRPASAHPAAWDEILETDI